MNLQQFIYILLARKRIFQIVFAVVVGTTTLLSLILPKQYTGAVTLVVDSKTPDPINGGSSQVTPGYMATQVDIITSERVGRRVVRMLGFEKVPELVEAWKRDADGKGSVEGYYAAKLGKKLEVKPSKESNVIEIGFLAENPKTAAAVANAFAQAYLETSVEIQTEPAKQYADYFGARIKEIQAKMEKEQAALSSYQKEKGIVSVDERLDSENSRLNELSTQLILSGAQKSEARSRQHQATGSLESNPDVMNNPNIQNLRATVTAAEGKLQQTSNELGQNHPQIKQQQAELESLKARLTTEMANVAASLRTNTLASTQKEAEIRAALEAQKKRVLELKNQRDEVSVMQAELASTQLDYNNLRQRLSQSSLQSQNQQSSVTILTPAFEPEVASKPRVMLNIVLSIVLGSMLGVGAAMLMEILDRRIRSDEDLAEIGIPLLGVLTVDRSSFSFPRWQFWRHLMKSS